MSLTLDKVSFTYGGDAAYAVAALRGVSLSIEKGTLTLVLGATGSGKSTLLRLAAGLLVPAGGSGTIDGATLELSTARGSVGLIFQDPEAQLFADTLIDDVAFGPRNLGSDPAAAQTQARQALAEVGLDPDTYGDRSPFSLSGGESRRAAIAGVLAMAPRYLLADEPTAGLDAPGRGAVRSLLADQRKHAGVVVVSHAAEEFLGLADTVVLLKDGAVGWAGAAAEAIASPEVFSANGLRAPEVLETQRLAALSGRAMRRFTLDPVQAAEWLSGGA